MKLQDKSKYLKKEYANLIDRYNQDINVIRNNERNIVQSEKLLTKV